MTNATATRKANTYAGTCSGCGTRVQAGAGHLGPKVGGKWTVEHTFCTATTPTRTATKPAGARCENCHQGAARYNATDSSGLGGRVCGTCSRYSRYELSFG